jgi:hypothetical protein
MRRWTGLILIAGVVVAAMTARPALAADRGRGGDFSRVARPFRLGDLADLGDLLGLGGSGLGSLADLLGLGGDSDALGGILGDVIGGLGGRRDRYDDRYSGGYDAEDYDYEYRRPRSRRGDRDRTLDRIFGRLDLGGNGFVEPREVSRFARRPGRGARSPQATFDRLDRNRDGRLSHSEFVRLF